VKTQFGLILTLVTVLYLPIPASGEDTPAPSAPVVSENEIARALKASGGTTVSKARGLSRRPDTPPVTQSINLNIPFKYNSSTLQPQASDQLKQLELALTSDSLRNDRFVVAGHTDAKGNARYNKQLSLKRAESVRHFLIANGVDTGRLDAVGYGSEQPLTPDRPEDPANRRVEIRDLGPASSAR
jgi:outer membrane protein OmpA-like peptidoglycan-associated protein